MSIDPVVSKDKSPEIVNGQTDNDGRQSLPISKAPPDLPAQLN